MIRIVVSQYPSGELDLQSIYFYSVVPEIQEYTDFWGEPAVRNYVSRSHLSIRDDFKYGRIEGVYTKPEYANQGHASRVMEVLIEYARQLGIEKLTLGVKGGEKNIAAVKLYTKFGFVWDPDQHDKIWMTLRLT